MRISAATQKIIKVYIGILVLTLAPQVEAELIRDIASARTTDRSVDRSANLFPMQHAFQSISSGRQLSQKDILFRNLLNTKGKDIAWPPFPRTWHEQSVTETIASNTAFGLNTGTIGVGISIDYKFALKTSLVIVASSRSTDAVDLDETQVSLNPVVDPLHFEIFKYDPVSHRTLPNVRPGYPMVAFCAFEASLNFSTSEKAGLNFFGNGQSIEHGRLRTISHSLFSRFIPVDGVTSPSEMLDQICNAQFRKLVEQYVIRDFSRAVVEATAYSGPANECQEDPLRDGPDGDFQCVEWFKKKNFSLALAQLTVPRCVHTRTGMRRCVLNHKAAGNCPMVWGKSEAQVLSPEFKRVGHVYTSVTNGAFEFPCDKKRGLTCQVVQQPRTLANIPLWNAVARCAPR